MLNIFCNFEIDFHILKGTNVFYIIHFYQNCVIRLTCLKSKLVNVFRKFVTYNLSAEEGIYSLSI